MNNNLFKLYGCRELNIGEIVLKNDFYLKLNDDSYNPDPKDKLNYNYCYSAVGYRYKKDGPATAPLCHGMFIICRFGSKRIKFDSNKDPDWQ